MVTFVAEDIGLTSLLSDMPRCARLRFPDPRVSTAGRGLLEPSTVVSALVGPMTSSPLSSAFSASFGCCLSALLLAGLFCVMVLLSWLAAFCAAENTEEKNPVPGEFRTAVPPGVFASSGCGVRGAEM